MLLATALALLITGCAQQDALLFKQTGSSEQLKETITHHFFLFLNWAEEKNCRCSQKFVAAQKMLLKQKPSKHS